jgi:hypothetical protein
MSGLQIASCCFQAVSGRGAQIFLDTNPRSLSEIDLLFLKFRDATMWIGISLFAGDRSKQVVAIQERGDIELLRRLEGEKVLLAASLSDFWCQPVAEQLQQIAGCAHQLPLRTYIVVAAQAEAPKISSLLDLTEYRFDNRLPHFVNRFACLGA